MCIYAIATLPFISELDNIPSLTQLRYLSMQMIPISIPAIGVLSLIGN